MAYGNANATAAQDAEAKRIMDQWEGDYARMRQPSSVTTHGGPVNMGPAAPTPNTGSAVGAWNNYGNPTGGAPSAPAVPEGGATPPYQLSTPSAPAGTASTDALNKVVEPSVKPGGDFGGAGLALSAIGGGGAMGSQERPDAMTTGGGGLRPLGYRRTPPMSMQVLGRRSY